MQLKSRWVVVPVLFLIAILFIVGCTSQQLDSEKKVQIEDELAQLDDNQLADLADAEVKEQANDSLAGQAWYNNAVRSYRSVPKVNRITFLMKELNRRFKVLAVREEPCTKCETVDSCMSAERGDRTSDNDGDGYLGCEDLDCKRRLGADCDISVAVPGSETENCVDYCPSGGG